MYVRNIFRPYRTLPACIEDLTITNTVPCKTLYSNRQFGHREKLFTTGTCFMMHYSIMFVEGHLSFLPKVAPLWQVS